MRHRRHGLPTAKSIAFVSDRSGSPQVYIMASDGSGVRRLTFEGSYNTNPAWSPKGDRIALLLKGGRPFPDLHDQLLTEADFND